jgi:hypothetical protein
MPKETVGLKIDIDSRSVATAARRSDDLARSSDRVSAGLRNMGRAAAAVGVAAAAAVAGVVALTMKIAEQSDEIAKNSRMMGLTAESYQELAHALELSGSSIGEASSGIRRLSANMLDAQQGLTTAVDAFGELGVEAITAQGELRDFDSVLADIADEFAAMPDGAEKTARAMELFGRSGAALIPMLNNGSAGIAEMRAEAHELGIVITDETAAAAEALNDDLTRLRGVARGFANTIATGAIPVIREFVGKLEDMARNIRRGNIDIQDLSRRGMAMAIEAMQLAATVAVRAAQGVLFLRDSWVRASNEAAKGLERIQEFASRAPVLPLRVLGSALDDLDFDVLSEEELRAQLSGASELSGELENLLGHIQALDNPVPASIVDSFNAYGEAVGRAAQRVFDLRDLDPGSGGGAIEETARELDKFELAAKASSAALVELRAHQLTVADGMRRIVAEAREAIKAIAEDKSAEEALLQKQQLIQDQAKALAEASAHVQKETVDMGDKFTQLGKLGASAFGGLVKGFQDLSLAALWKKDGNALKDFGKSLGKMLIQLGTMAVAYAAVAALGSFFPALIPLVGKPAGAPALLAAGVGALAAGAVLGAAIPRGGRGADPTGGSGDGEPRSVATTNVYNVAFDSFSPPRSRSRAVLESIGSAVAEGA